MPEKVLHNDVFDKGLEQISSSANWGSGTLTMVLCVGVPANQTEASTLYPTGKRISSEIVMAGGDLTLGDKAGGGREVVIGALSGTVEAIINTLIDSGTAESGAASTLTDTDKAWTVDAHVSKVIKIIAGTGSGQALIISSNTANTVTVTGAWATQPDATSVYEIRQNMTGAIYDGGGRLLLVTDDSNDQSMEVLNNPINIPSFAFGVSDPV